MKVQIDTDRLNDAVDALEVVLDLLGEARKDTDVNSEKLMFLMRPHVDALRELWEQAEGSRKPPEERDRRAHVAKVCREVADKLDGGEVESE